MRHVYLFFNFFALFVSAGKMDCERLHQLDELFKHYPAEVSEDEVLQYRRLVARAEIRELAQANVILCSPATMATSSLLSALCIQQVSQVH